MENKWERSELTPCNGVPCTDIAHSHPSPLRQALDKARDVNVEAGIKFLNQASATICKSGETLGAELFDLVEHDQCYAFVPVAISDLPDERVFDIARSALKHTEITAKKIRQWLKKHNQNPGERIQE